MRWRNHHCSSRDRKGWAQALLKRALKIPAKTDLFDDSGDQ